MHKHHALKTGGDLRWFGMVSNFCSIIAPFMLFLLHTLLQFTRKERLGITIICVDTQNISVAICDAGNIIYYYAKHIVQWIFSRYVLTLIIQ